MSTAFAQTIVAQAEARVARRCASVAFLEEIARLRHNAQPLREMRGLCTDDIGNRHAWRIVIEDAPREMQAKRLCRIILHPYISTVVPVMDADDDEAMRHAGRLFRDLIAAWDLRIEAA
jgi:hypothetical protein